MVHHLFDSIIQVFPFCDLDCFDAVCLCQGLEVRIYKFGKRITTVEEQLLPLTYHAKEIIVEENNLDRYLGLMNSSQFLDGHLESTVTNEKYHFPVWRTQFGSHCCRQTEANGSKST